MAVRTRVVDVESLTDRELSERAAGGGTDAFEILYRRHAEAAWRIALAVTDNVHDAGDAVSDAFTRMLQALASGRVADDVPFRPYLLTTTRNAAIDILRRRQRMQPSTEIDLRPSPAATSGPPEQVIDDVNAALVADAFRSLPERWRSVLWLTAVEGIPTREVGARLGLSANGAAQLAVRARNGLRERYVQAHLRAVEDTECQETAAQLPAYVGAALGARATAKVKRHLESCQSCRARLREVEDIDSELKKIMVPLPLFLGGAALEHFQRAMAEHHALQHALLLGGSRTVRLARRYARPLAVADAAVLALGVITAAVVGGSHGPRATPGAQPAPLPPANRTVDAIAPPPVQTATLATAVGPTTAVDSATGTTAVSVASNPPAPVVTTHNPSPPSSGTNGSGGNGGSQPPPPSTQVSLGLNAAVTTASVSAGLSNGACTGVSIAGSASCAPPPPSSPGVQATISTPSGKTSVTL